MKKWLQRNKIYFQTVAYIVLASAAIVVACQANSIAKRQAEIAEKQTEILRIQQLPMIHASVELLYDAEAEYYSHDELVIMNLGKPFSNLRITPEVFFAVYYGDKLANAEVAMIPIVDYYFVTERTSNVEGQIAKLYQENNHYITENLNDSFRGYTSSIGADGYIDLYRYIEVTYDDILGNHHIEAYYIDPIVGESRLTTFEKITLDLLMRKSYEWQGGALSVKLSEATPELLISRWEAAREIMKQHPFIEHQLIE